MHTETELRADMIALVRALIPEIGDEYRAYPDDSFDDDDAMPSMLLTVGADADGWSYQTGDNSYSGGAYGYATWAVVGIYRDSVPEEIADDILSQLYELAPDDEPVYIPDDSLPVDDSNGGVTR